MRFYEADGLAVLRCFLTHELNRMGVLEVRP